MQKFTPQEVYNLFVHRSDILAFQRPDGQYAGNIKTNPEKYLDYIKQHLTGKVTLGVYALKNNRAKWLCLDIDCKQDPEKGKAVAQNLSFHLQDLNIPHSVEFSGKKGYHLWIFFERAHKAKEIRAFAKWLLGIHAGYSKSKESEYVIHSQGVPVNIEIFPKQEETEGIGSLVKIPLGKHRNSGAWSEFIRLDKDFAEMEYLKDLYSKPIEKKIKRVGKGDKLSAGEMNVYRALKELCKDGETRIPLARLCDHTGYKSRETVSTHLRSLAGKGIIDAERRATGTFRVARARYGGKETELQKREYFVKVHALTMPQHRSTASSEPSWKVSSPFRRDRKPSFVYLPRIGIFKDYATGEIFSKDRMRKILSTTTY